MESKAKPKRLSPKEAYERENPKAKERSARTLEYIGKSYSRSPEYAKKQFGVKTGEHSKLTKKDYPQLHKAKKATKKDLSKAYSHMKAHGG